MKNKNLQLNNKGAAMMVAILAVALFAIIGGMILSTTIAMSTRANRVSAYADEKCILEMAAEEIIETKDFDSLSSTNDTSLNNNYETNGNKTITINGNTLEYTFDSNSKKLTLTSKNLQLTVKFNNSTFEIQSWIIEKKTADGNT